jgi:dolichol kinase
VLALLVFVLLERQKRRLVPRFFRLFYRDHELGTVAYEPFSYFLSIVALLGLSLAFMPLACYVGIIVMTVGDGVAALAGRSVRGPRLPYSYKTLSGSLAGFIAAAAAGYLVAGLAMAVAGAAGGMAAEAYAGKYDNAITAAAAFACAALASAFLHL